MPRRQVIAGAVGNLLEWYDFALYIFFASTIAKQFFPRSNELDSLIATFGVFAAGYVMRPLGGILFGHIGDRHGRKAALVASTLAMGLATFAIGVLPTAAEIGAWAAGLLVACRLLQGLSIGGEYTGSVVFLVERAGPGRRGILGTFSIVGAGLGNLAGSATAAVIFALLPAAEVADWGWRLPFLGGLVLGVVGVVLRLGLPAPPETPKSARWPIVRTLRESGWLVLRVAGLNVMHAVGVFMLFIFMKAYLHLEVGLAQAEAATVTTFGLIALMAVTISAGALSDRLGRRPVLLGSAAALILFAYPLLLLINQPGLWGVVLGQLAFALIIGSYAGTAPATMAELVPRSVRVTGTSLGYNLCMALFGGTTPMVTLWLIREGGSDLTPAVYLMAAAAVSLLTVRGLPETAKKALD